MTSPELERLADSRLLEREPSSAKEIETLVTTAERRLADASRRSLSLESRFTLAYDAAHAFALAGLRRAGYRSANRYLVFQCLEHTLRVPSTTRRLLTAAHQQRNKFLYDGVAEFSDHFVGELLTAARAVLAALRAGSPEG